MNKKIINPENYKFVPVGIQSVEPQPLGNAKINDLSERINRPNVNNPKAINDGYYKAISRYSK